MSRRCDGSPYRYNTRSQPQSMSSTPKTASKFCHFPPDSPICTSDYGTLTSDYGALRNYNIR